MGLLLMALAALMLLALLGVGAAVIVVPATRGPKDGPRGGA
jgi:hypothetical protein